MVEKLVVKPQRVYIAGPLGRDPGLWVPKAVGVGIELYARGHFPFIPHLSYYVSLQAEEMGEDINWGSYMAAGLSYLGVCDALFFMEEAKGAILELRQAQAQGLTIYRDLAEVPWVE